MGQTTNQIEAHIEHTREDLGSNLQELEQKVKSVTDWKKHFRANPMTMLGVAFGGGIMLATMLGGRKNGHGRQRVFSNASEQRAETSRPTHKSPDIWENIKGALVGVAATRFKDFVGQVVPGFHEQLQRTEAVKAMQPQRGEQTPKYSSDRVS